MSEKSVKKGLSKEVGAKGNVVSHHQKGGTKPKLSFGIQLLMEKDELVLETQLEGVESAMLKELAADKLLRRPKETGFSHSVADTLVVGKLKEMEEVDVKNKSSKGRVHGN